MPKIQSACFSGHRAEKLGCTARELAPLLHAAIKEAAGKGYTTFYHGGCTGTDLIAARQVLLHREGNNHIRLVSVIPVAGQEKSFSKDWQLLYRYVLAHSNKIVTLFPFYTPGCYQIRNTYMVENSSLLIAAYGGRPGGTQNTIRQAKALGRSIHIIHLP